MVSRELLPPPEGETVSVSVKVPKDLAANTMRVMYRSEKCPITRSDGSGGRYEIDGAKAIEVEPQRQGVTDIYEAKLAKDGGGFCEWKLSNVTFGVRYQSVTKFGQDAQVGGGGGMLVIFDDNRPQQVSLLRRPEKIFGDLVVENGYYVWVHEHHLIEEETWVWLYDGVGLYRTYKAKNAKSVIFKPFLHKVGVVRSFGPKEKKEGNHIRFLYPDGSVSSDYRSEPDIRKLNELRRR
ncbi:hypothetical protein thsps21_60630 [Pseudomonas sp. No.21]|uniref:hypothetical protein n=1 Tax=Pseudomonas TaxID=286 RepID=UPI0011B621AA|nr:MULTISPECIES: hypothetical protein [Pseudomonas]MDW3714087.1 hypothetical protein [Pseudomonas sp. 2023EL-01195]GJN50211.1 hypothetical protein TUM20249_61970 [Pseudomonas tohonis]